MSATGELQPSPVTGPTVTGPTVSEGTEAVRAKMSGHYDDALAMRRAITMGDVATLKAVASQLASDRWLPSLDSSWAAPLASVRAAAARVSQVTTVEAGAVQLAAVGTACAACHQLTAGPRKGIALSAPAGEEQPTMLSHQAAIDELWDGLVTPDAAAWQRGALALSSEAVAGAYSPEAQRAARQLQDLARRSIGAASNEREALMAQSLSTCAHCHRLQGVRTADPSGAGAVEK